MKEGSALSVTVLCVGKLRERFYADAAQEYLKRLSRLMPTEVVELPDEKEPANPSPALNEAVMRKEGEAILRHIPPKAYVITKRTVKRGDVLKLTEAPGGGFAISIIAK